MTLFASGDSLTSAKLVPGCPRALRLDQHCVDPMAPHFVMLEQVFRAPTNFDIIHFHIDYLHFPLSRRLGVPSNVTTLHGRLDIADLQPLYREYCSHAAGVDLATRSAPAALVQLGGDGLSRSAARPPSTDHRNPASYLAFLGRISPEKGCDRAIEIARRAGMPIKIAAKIDKRTARITSGSSSRCSNSRTSNTSARSTSRRRTISWAMPCPAVSHRLARAVWAGHDRVDGVSARR